jgi:uncharacterized protein YuzE
MIQYHHISTALGNQAMAQVKVYYDKQGNTLTVWFDDPKKEYIAEETGEEVILMKDEAGQVIGFEKLNFSLAETEQLHVAFEAMTVQGLE